MYPEEIRGEGVEWLKVKHILDPILEGKRGIDMGCGARKWPGSLGVDFRPGPEVDYVFDVVKRKVHAVKKKCDYVFSSHLLEDFPKIQQVLICQEWIDYYLKEDGGLLVLYVPQHGAYKGTNPNHEGEFNIGDMERLFQNLNLWKVLIYYENHIFPGWYGILGVGLKH